MKSSSLLPVLALLGEKAVARPYRTTELSQRATGDVNIYLPLDKRVDTPRWCIMLSTGLTVMQAAPEYKAEILFAGAAYGLSGLTAYDVCTHLPGNNDCSRFAYLVADVVTVIAEGVTHRKDLPLYGNEKAKDELKSRDLFQRSFEDRLLLHGQDFEAVNVMPIASRGETGEPSATKLQVLGLRHENGDVADHELHMRSDMTGVARLSVPSRSVDGTLERRGSGYDFLVSYKAYKYDMSTQPDENGIKAVADAIGKDWASRMTDHKDWANYIAAAQFGSQWRINFDIIPEAGDNWSENAVSQNVCGNAEYNF
ncbi:hypothetical protein F4813DRAFT_108310 [Daldinia decipiens]|uniref:uncharacterized protein n=1 Tax=Daldinia decipiens TaxID=326647 RepID=UPI0020C1EDB6|nr:uncharacterized protein F4813DRAFT_108310 [Daldinia decipiens]KAI1662442.1 hypothetical protein F4813DRAFT_108310 [Daldinia decipiens]